MKKKLIIILLLNMCYCSVNCQNKITTNTILEGVWKLDLEDNNQYEDYEMYVLYYKNIRYQFDFHPKNPKEYDVLNLSKNEYSYLKKSSVLILEKLNYNEDSLMKNIKKYETLFTKDKDFLESEIAQVIHLSRKGEKVLSIGVWSYEIEKDNIVLRSLGDGPSQPQNGYSYMKTKKIPKEVENIIRKIKSAEIKKIRTSKSLINSSVNTPTKMYLIKGDEVEILEEKSEWLRIRYYGNKTIEGWIKKSDVE